jgi:hypothetical protein
MVDAQNAFYSSTNGVLFDVSQSTLIDYPGGLGGPYIIPSSVTNIGSYAFDECAGLTSVTIPGTVASLGEYAFAYCTGLSNVYFTGNAPSADASVFTSDNNATAYYLAGASGWSSPFAGIPAMLWDPFGPSSDPNVAVQANQFGFSFSGPANLVVVVEAATNLANPVWMPLSTNTLTNGTFFFSDPQWTSFPSRFYRIISP